MRKILIFLIVLLLTVSSLPLAKSVEFKDTSNHWARDYIQFLVNEELINGYPDRTFKPDEVILYTEFIKIIISTLDIDLDKKDYKEHWAQKYLDYAKDNNYIDINENNAEKLGIPITRIEMAKIIVRILDKEGLAKEFAGINTRYIDDNDIAYEDKGYVFIASKYGIINGFDDETFRPDETATRAQAAKMIVTFLNNKDKKIDLIEKPIGINLSHIHYWSSQWMFVDAMKQSWDWFVQDIDGIVWNEPNIKIPLRDDGYPKEVPFMSGSKPYRVHTIMFMDMRADGLLYPEGYYTLIFEGKGEVIIEWDTGCQVFTESNKPHKVYVKPSDYGVNLIINKSYAEDPVRNIRFIMPGYEDTYETEPFHPKFLELLEPFQVIRYMRSSYTEEGSIESWNERAKLYDNTQSNMEKGGLAVEYIVMLSNKLKKDPWIIIPYRADDNYVAELAKYLHKNLSPDLKAYIEYGNETWNSIFPAYNYVNNNGLQLNLSLYNDPYKAGLKYSALRSLQIFKIFEDEYCTDINRIVKVMSAHGENLWTGEQMVEVVKDPKLNIHNVAVDAIAIAPYFGFEAANELGDMGDFEVTVDEILDKMEDEMIKTVPQSVSSYFTLAKSINADLISYEGGQHFSSLFYPDNDKLVNLMIEINRHPRMKDLYLEYFDLWYQNGGKLFMNFVFVEEPNNYGAFGILEHLYQDLASAPIWQAMETYLNFSK